MGELAVLTGRNFTWFTHCLYIFKLSQKILTLANKSSDSFLTHYQVKISEQILLKVRESQSTFSTKVIREKNVTFGPFNKSCAF